jgi:inhibitor of KinA sporulation pathway (predicted exonuclease)
MPVLGLPPDPPLTDWPRHGTVGILDLEYTAWEGSAQRRWSEQWEWREIVQMACVLTHGEDFSVVDEFELLVRPRRNQQLSHYFTALTGITQKQIEQSGRLFEDAATALLDFSAALDVIIFNGYDGQILRENCALCHVDLSWPDARMFDFRPLLARTLGRPKDQLTSSDLPQIAGVSLAGRAHSALYDCRAIAAALAHWRANGVL